MAKKWLSSDKGTAEGFVVRDRFDHTSWTIPTRKVGADQVRNAGHLCRGRVHVAYVACLHVVVIESTTIPVAPSALLVSH